MEIDRFPGLYNDPKNKACRCLLFESGRIGHIAVRFIHTVGVVTFMQVDHQQICTTRLNSVEKGVIRFCFVKIPV